jgi:hypothetical protein
MDRLFNILILLGIISFAKLDFKHAKAETEPVKLKTHERGPVYNPLRPKPYLKYSAKV